MLEYEHFTPTHDQVEHAMGHLRHGIAEMCVCEAANGNECKDRLSAITMSALVSVTAGVFRELAVHRGWSKEQADAMQREIGEGATKFINTMMEKIDIERSPLRNN